MQEWLIGPTRYAVFAIDAMALAVIVLGSARAFYAGLRAMFVTSATVQLREIWLDFGHWLTAGLTFQLAADVVETSIAPTWDELGRLGAIAAIRTFLNFFLERDLADLRGRRKD